MVLCLRFWLRLVSALASGVPSDADLSATIRLRHNLGRGRRRDELHLLDGLAHWSVAKSPRIYNRNHPWHAVWRASKKPKKNLSLLESETDAKSSRPGDGVEHFRKISEMGYFVRGSWRPWRSTSTPHHPYNDKNTYERKAQTCVSPAPATKDRHAWTRPPATPA